MKEEAKSKATEESCRGWIHCFLPCLTTNVFNVHTYLRTLRNILYSIRVY